MPKLPGFIHQQQEQTNWCWAATGVNAAAYYGLSTVQCQVVSQHLEDEKCCDKPCPAGCNQGWALSPVLRGFSILRYVGENVITPATVVGELQANRPIGFRYKSDDEGIGHVALVVGLEGDGTLHVSDAEIIVPIRSSLRALYEGAYRRVTGKWTHSYLFERHQSQITLQTQAITTLSAMTADRMNTKSRISNHGPREAAIVLGKAYVVDVAAYDLSARKAAAGMPLASARPSGPDVELRFRSESVSVFIPDETEYETEDIVDASALANLWRAASSDDRTRLRYVRITGLNIEAVFDQSTEIVYPLVTRARFLREGSYGLEAFMREVRERAIERYAATAKWAGSGNEISD